MANAVLAWENLADTGSLGLAVGAAVASLPLGNVASPSPALVARLAPAGGVVELQLAVALPVAPVVLYLAAALPLGSTVAVTAGAASANGLVGAASVLAFLPVGASGPVAIRITVPGTTDYVDVGRLWLGPYVQPAINFSYGAERQVMDTSQVATAVFSGRDFIDHGVSYDVVRFAFDALVEADAAALLALRRAAGQRAQVLYVPDPAAATAADDAVLGLLAPGGAFRMVSFGRTGTSFEIRESL
jgi:hypothetical protein